MTDNVRDFNTDLLRQMREEMHERFNHLDKKLERLSHIDKGILALRRDAVATDEGAALQRVEFERLAVRVERIARRLELRDKD
jgi:hypothetical protein